MSVSITSPQSGAELPAGQNITITGTGQRPDQVQFVSSTGQVTDATIISQTTTGNTWTIVIAGNPNAGGSTIRVGSPKGTTAEVAVQIKPVEASSGPVTGM